MKKEIELLQSAMALAGTDFCLVPSGDGHGSEYFAPHFDCCTWLSGLTSEAQTLLVTRDAAFLWTDGRYFLQAERQLAGSGITLMRMGEPGVPRVDEKLLELVRATRHRPAVLAFDGSILTAGVAYLLAVKLIPTGCKLRGDLDLVGQIWRNRPSLQPAPLRTLPLSSAGRTVSDKLSDVRAEMKKAGVTHLLLTDLMECAWLSNLRGADVAYTPVFFAYGLVTGKDFTLFTMAGLPEDADPVIQGRPYEAVGEAVASLPAGSVVRVDGATCSFDLMTRIPRTCRIQDQPTPVALLKAVKNEGELTATRLAHLYDGLAMVKFLRWVKAAAKGEAWAAEALAGRPLTELSAAAFLRACRMEEPGCFDLSFETISAYMENGAVIHYAPTAETDKKIQPAGFLLVDSGGQYQTGTTDITRTIALGPLTEKMKTCYTLVLKSHIALAAMVFDDASSGADMDAAARKPLRDQGLDFLHGISHGVGHVLSVHEGPNGIRRNPGPSVIRPGMIQSDEPGVYLAHEFGVRIENELLCVPAPEDAPLTVSGRADGSGPAGSQPAAMAPAGSKPSRYQFESLTLCPYDRAAIDPRLLTPAERAWVDRYHQRVYEALSPRLQDQPELLSFLAAETRPL